MLDSGGERGRREFEKIGRKAQAAVVRHLDIENVLRVGLCLYALSGNGGHKDEARLTLDQRPDGAGNIDSSRSNSLRPKLGNLSCENRSNTSERASSAYICCRAPRLDASPLQIGP